MNDRKKVFEIFDRAGKITYDGKQTTHKINLSAKSDNIFEIEI